MKENFEKFSEWRLVDDVLYKHVPSDFSFRTYLSGWKMVVHKVKHLDVLRTYHDSLGYGKLLKGYKSCITGLE